MCIVINKLRTFEEIFLTLLNIAFLRKKVIKLLSAIIMNTTLTLWVICKSLYQTAIFEISN